MLGSNLQWRDDRTGQPSRSGMGLRRRPGIAIDSPSEINRTTALMPAITLPDGSEVQDPGSIDSYTWVLRVGPACQ